MSKPGHNSGKCGPVAGDRLKSFVERIERMEEERKAIGADIRDIYAEAKGVGYDVKTVRWVVQERRMDASDRAERDTLRDVYQHALDTAVDLVRGGLSLREAGRITGRSKSSIHRALAVPEVSQPASPKPEDGDDGIPARNTHDVQADEVSYTVDTSKITKTEKAASQGSPCGPDTPLEHAVAGTSEPDPDGEVRAGTHSDEAGIPVSVGAVASESERVATPFLGDDPGPPPAFLRRSA